MSTPEADEPTPEPRRPTGVGWPDAPPPPPPPPPPPEPEPPRSSASQRRDLSAARDTTVELPRQASQGGDFASRAQAYRAGSPQRRSWQPTPPDRPGTVTAAAVILFIGAGLGLLACCGLNVLAGESALGDDEQNVLLLVSAVIVVFSLLNAGLGYFVLQGRQWARVTTIVLCVIGIITSLVSLFVTIDSTGGSNSLGTCFGIVLNAVIIGLLSGSRASDYFRYARG